MGKMTGPVSAVEECYVCTDTCPSRVSPAPTLPLALHAPQRAVSPAFRCVPMDTCPTRTPASPSLPLPQYPPPAPCPVAGPSSAACWRYPRLGPVECGW